MPRRRDPHHRRAEVAAPERGSSHEPETIRLELRAATSLARAWARHGRVAEAAACLADICAWFDGRPETPDLVDARTQLATLAAGG